MQIFHHAGSPVITESFVKLLAITILSLLLLGAAAYYCFEGRRVSRRPGAFYLLVVAVAFGALFVSGLAAEGARLIRDSITSAYSGTGDLLGHAGGDPSGFLQVARQSNTYLKPSVWEKEDLREWQRNLKSHLSEDVYDLDFSSSVASAQNVQLRRTVSDEKLVRKEYVITAADGDSISAVLLMPTTSSAPLPTILFLHGHVRDDQSGLAQMVLPVNSYQRAAARELAMAGFATLTIELRGFGMRGPPAFPNHRIVAYNAVLTGSFYKKLVIQDIKLTVDFLENLPEIDRDRLGISGVSLGAELAVEYGGLDERIKVVSFHSHGGRVGPYPGISATNSEQPHYCHLIPGVSEIMHREDPFMLLAPRPTQGLRGEREPFRDENFAKSLRRAWSLMGEPDAIEIEVMPNEGHAYFVDQAIRFFEEHL